MAKPDEYNWGSSNTTDTAYFRTAGSPMSAALLSNGYAGAEIPANQDHNTLFRNAYLWQQYHLSRAESTEDTLLYSSGTATWNGSTLTLSANLDFKFRKSTGQQVNRIASGALAFTDGHVLVLRRDKASASPVTLSLAASYGALATGQYVIVAETSLTEDNEEYETVIFRRNGTTLECPSLGLIYSSGAVITFGNFVDVAANYTWTGSHTFSALSTHSLGLSVATTKPVNLNVGGTSYLKETSAGVVDGYAGSENFLKATQSTRLLNVGANWNFALPTGTKLGLNLGLTTYLSETSAGVLSAYANSINVLQMQSSGSSFYRSAKSNTSGNFVLGVGIDASSTQWGFRIDTGDNLQLDYTGGAWTNPISFTTNGALLLADIDPPAANYMNRNSGCKAWLRYTDGSGVVTNSYNIDSVTSDDGDGVYTVNFDTDFASTSYCITGCAANNDHILTTNPTAAGNATVYTYDASLTAGGDDSFSIAAFGDQ